ncbi:MAG: GH25 family lysozyme [Pelolinea sp.]|nr:GH25 family lysozyme [Pelolinea sp.]
MISGIDVSHWQNDKSTPQKMNFTKAKAAGAKFVFIKVSERGGMDEDFIYNWKTAKAAYIPRGGYHFLRWDISALLQARIFCELLKDDPGELPPVADFEAPIKDGKYPSNALLAAFLEAVESILGKRPMIYTSPGFWNSYGKNKITGRFDASWSYYPLWIAHYTTAAAPQVPEPWKSAALINAEGLALSNAEGSKHSEAPSRGWLFWQYTPVGDGLKFGAESKGLDMNWFNGNQAELNKLVNNSADAEPVEAPTGGGTDNAYLQKEIDLVASRIKNIENHLTGFRLP